MDLAEQVNRTIEQYKLFAPGDRIVVAVSGGADSTALLHLLFALSAGWRWELVVAHANHEFRPEESEREAAFVQSQAEALGLPFVYRKLDVPAYLMQHGGNPQEGARELRYRFLEETAEAWEASKIALAHHADDLAETVLMRIMRGTGIGGLAGITMRRKRNNVELVRPLLRIHKAALLTELARQNITYCEDSSNAKLKYTRNRVRLEALPYLAGYNPSVVGSLNRLADLASSDDDYMEAEASSAFSRLAQVSGEQVRFSRLELEGLHVALQRRFIKLILNYLSKGMEYQDFRAVKQVRECLDPSAKPNAAIPLSGGLRLVREYDRVLLEREGAETSRAQAYEYQLEGQSGRVYLPEARGWLDFEVLAAAEAERNYSVSAACFDAGELVYPVTARSRRQGDRMRLFGLNGSKKVKDIFIDHKVPRSLREQTPILTDGDGELLWIPGVRRSGTAPVTDATKQVFCITFRPLP